jgi:hypothetical protein
MTVLKVAVLNVAMMAPFVGTTHNVPAELNSFSLGLWSTHLSQTELPLRHQFQYEHRS